MSTTSSSVQPVPTSAMEPVIPQPPPGRLSPKRLAIAAAVVVVLAGAGIGTWLATRGGSSTAATPLSVTTQKVTVTTGTMKETVAASGTIEPTQDSTLTFSVSGTVNAVDVSTGQKVTAGETLASIDSTALSDEVAADQATVTSVEDRLSTDQAAGASTSQVDSDEASVTSAESQLSAAQANLADASLKASFNGTVAAVNLAVGDVVSGGGGSTSTAASSTGRSTANPSASTASSSSTGSSSDGITVISTGSYLIDTSVDDTEVGQIKVGDQAVIVPSGATTDIYGTVSSVSLVASSSTSSVAAFPVVIAVTGSPSGLFAGASATTSIIVEQINGAVEVPTAALTYSNGQASVTEIVSGSPKSVPVTTGITASGETQIVSGLKAGDVVTERVVKFNASASGARSLFGGAGGTGGTGTTRTFGGGGGGGFGGGGFGGGGGGTGFGGG